MEQKEREELTEREIEVIRLVATGATNRQIASELFISVNTVKVHLRNIFAKLGVNSRTELAMFAVREGLVEGVSLPEVEEVAIAEDRSRKAGAWLNWRLGLAIVALSVVLVLALSRAILRPTKPMASLDTAGSMALATRAAQERWTAKAPLPTPRMGLAVVAYEGFVYAIGGEAAEGVTGVVERYDPEADEWISLAGKPTPVSDVKAAVVGGRIYVPGGRLASGELTDVMEVYDPEEDRWEERAPLPIALSAYALAAFEGKLYLFGGWDGESYLASVYEYDPERDLWIAKAPMPTVRGFTGAAVVGNKIYVVGGYDGQRDLAINEEYDPSKDGWEERMPMPAGRSGAGVAAAINLIHVIGGWEGGSSKAFKYNIRDDNWQSFKTPIEGMWKGLGLAFVDTKMYAIGGWDGNYMSANQEYQAIYVIMLPRVP